MSCDNLFVKEAYEAFSIKADFGNNFITGETIASIDVSAVNKDGIDVTSSILGTSLIVGDDQVSVIVQAGSASASYYTITFKCITSTDAQWQLDVSMKVE